MCGATGCRGHGHSGVVPAAPARSVRTAERIACPGSVVQDQPQPPGSWVCRWHADASDAPRAICAPTSQISLSSRYSCSFVSTRPQGGTLSCQGRPQCVAVIHNVQPHPSDNSLIRRFPAFNAPQMLVAEHTLSMPALCFMALVNFITLTCSSHCKPNCVPFFVTLHAATDCAHAHETPGAREESGLQVMTSVESLSVQDVQAKL